MQNIFCFTGWGQKFDSLEFIFNDKNFAPFFVSSFDYSQYKNVDEFFEFIKSQNNNSNKNPEIVIGWSLGGQLAVRMIEKKILQPKLLILIAPPFQMIKDARIQAGMGKTVFKIFFQNFVDAPDQTLKKFSILMAMNDKNAKDIVKTLDINDKNFSGLTFWLEELARFSCFDVDFSNFPKTLFFQGAGDMIVHQSQAYLFKERIKDCHLEIFTNCGHAPQLNDVERMREIILGEINNLK